MAKFNCEIRQDGWIYWTILVDAENAEEAAKLAMNAWKHGDERLEKTGAIGFDYAECEPDDCQEV